MLSILSNQTIKSTDSGSDCHEMDIKDGWPIMQPVIFACRALHGVYWNSGYWSSLCVHAKGFEVEFRQT